MEESRFYRSYGAGQNVEIVSVKNLSENQMFVGRSSLPPLDPYPIKQQTVDKPTETKNTWWNDPEMKRKRRVAKYKLYSAEGKIKISLKKGLRWIKRKCIMVVRRL